MAHDRVIARVASLAVLAMLLSGCTDGATRIALQMESEVSHFGDSSATTYSYEHIPKASPAGCAGAYKLQFGARSASVVWCKGPNGEVTSSHTTTYHRDFVQVRETFIVEKATEEPTTIESEKRGGAVVVADVR